MRNKRILIIAGPNGAGKTTFARGILPSFLEMPLFVNADNIACGLNPFSPQSEALQAGKLMLRQIDKYVLEGRSFSVETTLAGKGYMRRIKLWKEMGYKVILIFLSLRDEQTAINRVASRVQQGGHNVPEEVIKRSFHKGYEHFEIFKQLVDRWYLFDNMKNVPQCIALGDNHDSR